MRLRLRLFRGAPRFSCKKLLLICYITFLLYVASKVLNTVISIINMQIDNDSNLQLQNYFQFPSDSVEKPGLLLPNSSKCQAPKLKLWNQDLRKYSSKVPDRKCSPPGLNLTFLKGHWLHVDQKRLKDYSLTCCYRTVTRVEQNISFYGHAADNGYHLSKCYPLERKTPLGTSSVRVICKDPGGREVYQNFHLVPLETTGEEKAQYWRICKEDRRCKADRFRNGRPPPNILIIGLDSTSRLNFRRTMPKTLDILERNLEAVEMKGFTKVGENTFPNIVPLLTSFSVEELRNTCYPTRWTALDNCPFIWKEVSQLKYLTAYLDDKVGTFNYYRTGFVHAPADIYSNPWILAATKDGRWLNSCSQSHRHEKAILEYVISLVTIAESKELPYFLIAWFSDMTHNDPRGAEKLDVFMASALSKLHKRKLLKNTAFFLMGDHGYRFYDYRITPSGWYEEKMPLLWVKPPMDKRSGSVTLKKLKLNAEVVTTSFDIHATLRHILKLPQNSNSEFPRRGLSLFRRIPDRTCSEAGIPLFYCPCNIPIEFDNRSVITQGAKAVVDHINTLIPSVCFPLSLQQIFAFAKVTNGEGDEEGLNLLLGIVTRPGGFRFEALVTFHKNSMEEPPQVIGLTRTNPVDPEVKCLEVHGLRNDVTELYCFCKVIIP